MISPVWLGGAAHLQLPTGGGAPVAWYGSLEDPASTDMLSQAAARPEDLLDFANRPGAELRILRRRLTRLLLSRLAGVHPGDIRFRRTDLGAVEIVEPAGWYVSVAGRAAQLLVGAGRVPIGVDLEILVDEPLPLDLLSDAERKHLATASDKEWTMCWAAKEAHCKRLGIASEADPALVTALPDSGDAWKVLTGSVESLCHFHWIGDTALAVALEGDDLSARSAAPLRVAEATRHGLGRGA